jgi:undecaprenyl-diphosphatase
MNLLNTITFFDHQMFYWCLQRKHRELMVFFGRCVSRTADGHLYMVGLMIAAGLSQWMMVKAFVVGFAIERAIYFVLKNTLKRRRPEQAIPHFFSTVTPSDQFSFPSGHTSAAFFVLSLSTVFFPAFSGVLFLWAACVGASRVIIGVHFPTDILAGAVLGYGMGMLTLAATSDFVLLS